jgi:hypothetical protein
MPQRSLHSVEAQNTHKFVTCYNEHKKCLRLYAVFTYTGIYSFCWPKKLRVYCDMRISPQNLAIYFFQTLFTGIFWQEQLQHFITITNTSQKPQVKIWLPSW